MDADVRAEYEAESQQLRVDLKKWENDWVSSNSGRKPGRDDIKANPDIASKYKQYAKLRKILSSKASPPSKDEPQPTRLESSETKKRKSDPIPTETPSKRSKYLETPSKDRIRDEELMNTPGISRKLFSPASVTSLGPTPQRDGRVLGLFDLLVEKELGTPTKKDGTMDKGSDRKVMATPSKRKFDTDDETATPRLGRTPMSSTKRQMLDSFMTPLKNRDRNASAATPSSVSKLQFDTPAFLKRHTLSVLDENGEFGAPAPLRLPRKPLVRGLSEIVASLRKVEEDQLDDDDYLDALREAESGGLGASKPKPQPKPKDDVLAPDSQIQRLPLGAFDDEAKYDSPDEDARNRDGNPFRVFKKKGQKRTTRKVNIKPTWMKRPTNVGGDHNEDSDVEKENAIPETQDGARDEESGSDFEDDKPKKDLKKKQKQKPAMKEGTVKRAARKVNELAHANFQRLKLKNTGAKGGPGYNSRFRRRR